MAKLRAAALNGEDVLLRTEMSAGHGGVSGRYKAWHDRAFSLAWILDRMGLAGVVSGPIRRALATNSPSVGGTSPEKSLRVLSRCNYQALPSVCSKRRAHV